MSHFYITQIDQKQLKKIKKGIRSRENMVKATLKSNQHWLGGYCMFQLVLKDAEFVNGFLSGGSFRC